MPNKKVIAYALDENNEYKIKEDGSLKVFWIDHALRMKSNDPHNFGKITFMSKQNDPDKRKRLFPIKGGFFRYEKGVEENRSDNPDADSLSHSIAIAVLSEMKEIRFVDGEMKLNIQVNEIRSEDTKIQFTNRDKYKYYYPDLVCLFSESKYWALKWGGKIAIEVKDTHACEKEKIYDFENHGVPILEVSLKGKTIEDIFETNLTSLEEIKKYREYLQSLFSNEVKCEILSNPVSVKYHKLLIKRLKEDHANITNDKDELISQFQNNLKEKESELKTSENISYNHELQIQRQNTYIEELENRGFWYHLKTLFIS